MEEKQSTVKMLHQCLGKPRRFRNDKWHYGRHGVRKKARGATLKLDVSLRNVEKTPFIVVSSLAHAKRTMVAKKHVWQSCKFEAIPMSKFSSNIPSQYKQQDPPSHVHSCPWIFLEQNIAKQVRETRRTSETRRSHAGDLNQKHREMLSYSPLYISLVLQFTPPSKKSYEQPSKPV